MTPEGRQQIEALIEAMREWSRCEGREGCGCDDKIPEWCNRLALLLAEAHQNQVHEQENKGVTTRMDRLSTSSDASRTAAPDVAEGARWHPIETAPKDGVDADMGRIILGFAPDEEDYALPSREGYWSVALARWVSSLDPHWRDSPQPTHWMPRPDAPRSER